jgi:hypothetical protein
MNDESPDESIGRLEREVHRLAQESQAMEERLSRAEHQARLVRLALGGLVLLVPFAIVAGRATTTASPRIVEAEWFALRDKEGKRRAVLHIDEGVPVLGFYDRDGKNVLQVVAWQDGSAGMSVRDTNGKVRLSVGRFRGGAVGLSVYHPNGRKGMTVGLESDGSEGVEVYDGEGMIRIENKLQPDGSARLAIFNQEGKSFYAPPGR